MFKFNFNAYVAIIGDIIQSKKLDNRKDSQIKLQDVLNSINKKYVKDIASNFMITLGDEFQGLLKCGENTINIISEIELEMYPVQIRFGIGTGEITTNINRDFPIGSDGPAYHNARKMIESLKNMEKKIKAGYSNIMIATQGDNSSADMLLNSIFSLCATIKKKWTKRQREIVFAYIKSENSQIKAAEKLEIKQSSVNKGLSGAEYYSYKNALDIISTVLSEIKADDNV
jgi:hypothetical protein